jgi:hypothetical protein
VGALANLGHEVSDQTVGNILRRHDIAPVPERRRTTSCKEFIHSHMDVLAGADFFTMEVDLARFGDLLGPVLHRSSQPRTTGRHHAPPGVALDSAGGTQCNDGGHRLSERLSLPATRSRQEVRSRVSQHARGGRCGMHADTTQKSEFERACGTLSTFDQRGMLVKADLVRGELAAARRVGISGTLPPREKPPR